MAKAVVITGSNTGEREAALVAAKEAICASAGRVVDCSPVMGSRPWGQFNGSRTPDFLNQVLVIETALSPDALLTMTQHIERELGRTKEYASDWRGERRYDSRTIDIDILFYDDRVVESDRLAIPHPRIAEREFVLRPLAAVMPDFPHPVTGETVCRMLERFDTAQR